MLAIYSIIAVSKMAIVVFLLLSTVVLLQIDPIVGNDIVVPNQLDQLSSNANFDLSFLTKDVQFDGSGVASTIDVEQLREKILQAIFEGYSDRIASLDEKIAAVGRDAEAILNLINEETGVKLFVISDGIVHLDADSLAELVLFRANAFIRTEFKNNPLQQIILIELLRRQVREKTSEVKDLLTGVPLADVERVIFSRGLKRSRRDAADVFQDLIKTILTVILSPIQSQINIFFNNATAAINLLYIPTTQNNAFVNSIAGLTNQVVLQIRQAIATAQQYVNNVFNNILQQNVTTSTNSKSTRRKRDINEESLLDLSPFEVEVPHSRVARSVTGVIQTVWNLIQSFFSPVFLILNTAIKTLLVSLLSTQYQNIGIVVTFPIRLIVQSIVDIIFPCSTCVSIL